MKIEPIRKTVTVGRAPAEAFKIWTEGIGGWWPAMGHSMGKERVVNVVFEPRVDGRVYEVWDDGSQHDWARVLVFEPPDRFVISWHPNLDRLAPTEVEVRFIAEGPGTRLELEHRAWERLGEEAPEVRESYDGGWPVTLERFAEATR
ncbi:MAG: SRPBCC family protein [Actinomycetota bacterium]